MSEKKPPLPLFRIHYRSAFPADGVWRSSEPVHEIVIQAENSEAAEAFWLKHFPTFPLVKVTPEDTPNTPLKVYEITWVIDANEESDGDLVIEAPDVRTALMEFLASMTEELHEVKIEHFPGHKPLLPLTDAKFNIWLGKVILELRKQYSEWAYKFELDVVKDVLDRRQNWREDFTSKRKIEDVCYFFLGDPPDEDEDEEEDDKE
jgi:hypothetical protein